MARSIRDIEPNNPCFANNYYIASLLHRMGQKVPPADLLGEYTNEFIAYNYSVVNESVLTHAWQKHPTLKSKLLFMDYRFRKLTRSTLFISDDPNSKKPRTAYKLIITFGREGSSVNDLQIAGSTNVSRRHCAVVNCRDDVCLYDLESTGTQVNGQRVKGKTPLVSRNIVRVGNKEFVITNDKDNLI